MSVVTDEDRERACHFRCPTTYMKAECTDRGGDCFCATSLLEAKQRADERERVLEDAVEWHEQKRIECESCAKIAEDNRAVGVAADAYHDAHVHAQAAEHFRKLKTPAESVSSGGES